MLRFITGSYLLILTCSAVNAASLISLGDAPGSPNWQATDISDNGQVVIGYYTNGSSSI
jgi:hypothetical protein